MATRLEVMEKMRPVKDLPRPSAIHESRNRLTIKPYIPKDPGRAARLLKANEAINRARAAAN